MNPQGNILISLWLIATVTGIVALQTRRLDPKRDPKNQSLYHVPKAGAQNTPKAPSTKAPPTNKTNLSPGDTCLNIWGTGVRGTPEKCAKHDDKFEKLKNIPFLSGAYCNNDRTGNCKGFSGRFEFLFNTFKDEIIGPAPQSRYVDRYGYHKRVPVAYNIKGNILYADRAINWARRFKKELGNKTLSLLSINDFNWCAYTELDWWPYKSAIKWVSPKLKKEYHIYFSNRQSCIYDSSTGSRQHFNTRFLHNSNLLMDLDQNPTIFAMEDSVTQPPYDIRLVKTISGKMYEVQFEVVENVTSSIRYYVRMSRNAKYPSKVNKSTVLFTTKSYRKFSDLCVTDYRTTHGPNDKVPLSMPLHCGTFMAEAADFPIAYIHANISNVNEIIVHGTAMYPRLVWWLYEIDDSLTKKDAMFVNDGYTYTAITTVPIKGKPNQVRVINLFSKYLASDRVKEYEENYPRPMMMEYTATLNKDVKGGWGWTTDRRSRKPKEVHNLNYVDDIAYLYKCHTILIIFGPLYSELPADSFNLETKAYVDSIYQLGIFEMANAFFNYPNTDIIYVYHRYNWIETIKYTCGKGGALVTAVKSGKYFPYVGKNMLDLFRWYTLAKYNHKTDYSEEYFWELLNIFKGQRMPPDAPDPDLYPLMDGPPEQAKEEEGMPWWVYLLIAVGLLLILAMILLILLAMRRRQGRHKAAFSSNWPFSTRRSSGISGKHASSVPSVRSSSLRGHTTGSASSVRSALRSGKKFSRLSNMTRASSNRLPPRSSSLSGSGSGGKLSSRSLSKKLSRTLSSGKMSSGLLSKKLSRSTSSRTIKRPSTKLSAGSVRINSRPSHAKFSRTASSSNSTSSGKK